jgi:hypothetical protein
VRYRLEEADASRTAITHEELRDLRWLFNFSAEAGGRGRSTLKEASFSLSKLSVPGYPPLAYRLESFVDDSGSGGGDDDNDSGDGDGDDARAEEPDVNGLGVQALKELCDSADLGYDDGIDMPALRALAREALKRLADRRALLALDRRAAHRAAAASAAGSSSGVGGSSSGVDGGGGSGGEVGYPRLSAIRSLMSQLLSGATAPATARSGRRPIQRQTLQIHNFPPHWVERLPETREWLIYNDNVTFVSCGPDGQPGSYDERGFLTDLTRAEHS